MRLDHIAYRVKNRHATVDFIVKNFGYSIGAEFKINFDDGTQANCFALVPPEKDSKKQPPWSLAGLGRNRPPSAAGSTFHLPPEIFVSDGGDNSIVGSWVKERGGVGGVHHVAYQVDDIDGVFNEWKDGGVEFLSEDIIDCPDDNLRQIFTKPLEAMGGVIVELIARGDKGFCEHSVKELMESTQDKEPDEVEPTVEEKARPTTPETLDWLYRNNQ
jgi:catechol 2,3-dioxygenase-like lactoylglutathione lyase family enzyme